MRLINDILDMRKVESGKLDLLMDVIDARSIVGRAIDGVKGIGPGSASDHRKQGRAGPGALLR